MIPLFWCLCLSHSLVCVYEFSLSFRLYGLERLNLSVNIMVHTPILIHTSHSVWPVTWLVCVCESRLSSPCTACLTLWIFGPIFFLFARWCDGTLISVAHINVCRSIVHGFVLSFLSYYDRLHVDNHWIAILIVDPSTCQWQLPNKIKSICVCVYVRLELASIDSLFSHSPLSTLIERNISVNLFWPHL